MKKLLFILPLLFMLCGCDFDVSTAESPFSAASQMKQGLENDNNRTFFLGSELEGDNTFKSLEAIYPYAFSMEFVYYPVGVTEISVNVDNKAMQEQARLLAEKIAKEQTKDITDPVKKLEVLHDYLTANCKYDIETASQNITDGTAAAFTAYGALVDGKAVCSGYARAFMMLCKASGIDVIYISDADMNHSWNAVKLGDEIYYIDCTFDDPIPDQGERIIRNYFLKTEQEMKKTHRWNSDFYNGLMGDFYAK